MLSDMKKAIFILTLLCGMGLTRADAQNKLIIEDQMPLGGVVIVTIDKAGDEIIRIMNESQIPYIHDPQAPRFLLMDKQGRFALGIGGFVRATASYDFGGLADSRDFIPADISMSNKLRNQYQMDASMSTIFLKLVGHTDLLGDFVVYTSGNFRGSGGSKNFQLRNAYLTFRDITVGYTYGGFMDVGAVPSTIDAQGPNGAAMYRATQLGYTYKGISRLRLHVGMEAPAVEGREDGRFDIGRQRMPDFTAYAQYAWNEQSHLRLAGIVRSMTYTSEEASHARNVTGWGLQASGNIGFCHKWRFYGQINYGRGIGQYLNDLGTLGVDLVPDPDHAARMQALKMLGWYTGVQYNATSKLYFSTTYSQSRLYADHHYPATDTAFYRYGRYFVLNGFWSLTPNMQVGAEYLRGWRTDFDGGSAHANRVNLLVQYSF